MTSIVPSSGTPFDGIRHSDEQGEYWLARELMLELGYIGKGNWQNFSSIIDDAKTACASQGYNVDEVFSLKTKNPTRSGGRPSNDYRLTRFACYMIAMSGEGSKPEIAAAKTYFAVKTQEREEQERQELLDLIHQVADDPLAEVGLRIAQRRDLTDANKALLKRAEQSGVITRLQRAIFMNWGYKGLYAGEVEDDIHERKELQPGQGISDWMGVAETMANVLRAMIAKRRMDAKGTSTPDDANYTHYLSGKTVRQFLASEGIYPEQLPTPNKSYRQIVKEAAAEVAEEERQEALEAEYRNGLWGQLPSGD